MAAIDVPPTKKAKLSDESGASVGGSSPSTSQNNKFQLLLSSTYRLNKSRSKSVIVGLKIDYATSKLEPVVGIFDQRNKGVILSESSFSDFMKKLEKIHEFFTMANNKNFSEKIGEPIPLTGFTLAFNHLSLNYTKSKAICIRECGNSTDDITDDSELPTVIMQQVTFDTLRDLTPLISEHLEYLDSVGPYVEECIRLLIDFTKEEMGHIQGKTAAKPWNSDILGLIMKNCVRRNDIHSKIHDKVFEMSNEMSPLTTDCIITELYVYHEEFLMKNVFA